MNGYLKINIYFWTEMKHTIINLNEKLPLTCSRRGSCCFGKQVRINPWELATLANTKGIPVKDFADQFCEYGGTKIRFNGTQSKRGETACSLYVDNFGCSVHAGRPLVCRLYPIGRRLQNGQIEYMYEGDVFPCMHDCSEVTDLPQLTVENYLSGQETADFEKAQDAYLELLQGLADIAITLVLETGLNENEISSTLSEWDKISHYSAGELTSNLQGDWLSMILQPEIVYTNQSDVFTQQHSELIQNYIQKTYDTLTTTEKITEISGKAFASALLLAYSVGIEPEELGKHWIAIVRANM